MKRARLIFAMVVVVALLSIGLGCAQPATADFTVTSSTDNNHSHNVVISGADVDNPTAASKTITSDGASHTHAITLTQQNFQSVKNGQSVTVTSTATGGTPHTHTFTIKKP